LSSVNAGATTGGGAGRGPAWVTVTVCDDAGPDVVENVNVPLLGTPGFAVAYTYTDVFPAPDVGDVVNHDVFEDVTAHAWVVDTLIYVPAPDVDVMPHVETSSDNPVPSCDPSCVTDTVVVT